MLYAEALEMRAFCLWSSARTQALRQVIAKQGTTGIFGG